MQVHVYTPSARRKALEATLQRETDALQRLHAAKSCFNATDYRSAVEWREKRIVAVKFHLEEVADAEVSR